jgi:hypothetical protein
MQNNGVPDETEFCLIGNSIYLRIPPNYYKHHEIEGMKKDKGPDRKPAKINKEFNPKEEGYSPFWNPEASHQQSEQ